MSQWDFGEPTTEPRFYFPAGHNTTRVYFPTGRHGDVPVDDGRAENPPTLPEWMTDPLSPYNAGVPSFQPQGAPFPPQDIPFPPTPPRAQSQSGTPVPPLTAPRPRRPNWLAPGVIV